MAGGGRLLQPAGGSDFNIPGPRHGYSRVAVPTRGAETEGHLIAAPGTRMCLKCDDLAGPASAFPRAAADGSLADQSTGS